MKPACQRRGCSVNTDTPMYRNTKFSARKLASSNSCNKHDGGESVRSSGLCSGLLSLASKVSQTKHSQPLLFFFRYLFPLTKTLSGCVYVSACVRVGLGLP